MEVIHEECFVVHARPSGTRPHRPDRAERPLARCGRYAEARRIQRRLHRAACPCVIRYVGPAGGGD
jgi:hypothetical protein